MVDISHSTSESEIMNVLGAKEKWFGYGVTVNIAASHVTQSWGMFTASPILVEGRGSSGFDSPYPNSFFSLSTLHSMVGGM